MPEKKKPIPKYRLNYLMKRIEEEGERKISEIGADVQQVAEIKVERMKKQEPKDMTPFEQLHYIWLHGTAKELQSANTRLTRRNKKNNRTRGGYGPRVGATPSCQDLLGELSGETKRIETLGKRIDKVQSQVWKDRSKRTNKVRDFVRNLKDEYMLGHDVDLVSVLEDFKTRKF